MDIAGKDGGTVWLHQDGQEGVSEAPFYGQFVPIWPVLAVFLAKNAYQTTGCSDCGKGLRDRQGLERQVLGKSCSHYGDMLGEKPSR